jgi:hypothetical protein
MSILHTQEERKSDKNDVHSVQAYAQFVNPNWSRLLKLLQMDVQYERYEGAEFRDYRILTQICGNNFAVLKLAPPLIVSQSQIDEAVNAIHKVVELAHKSAVFWTEALGLAQRAANV